MATAVTDTLRSRREAVIQAHIDAEVTYHDPSRVVDTFRHPRYEVPAAGVIADGPEAVRGLLGALFAAFPDFSVETNRMYHSDDAVIVETTMHGTQQGAWAGIEPAGHRMEVPAACIFVFEGEDLVCEKVYFDHATLARQLQGSAPD